MKSIKKLFSIIFILFLLACEKIEDALGDQEGPEVTSTTPANGDTDITITSTISVTFSEPVESSSVSDSNFTITGNGSNLQGDLSVNSNIITFKPNNGLIEGIEYTATIGPSIKDLSGNDMLASHNFSFSTEKPATPAPVASFEFTKNEFIVSFSNFSTHATSYLWEFGDGTTSTEKNPVKTYQENGDYLASLTSKGPGGSSTLKKAVIINVSSPIIELPDSYLGKWYTVGGNFVYEIGENSTKDYIRTNNVYYYYDPETDLNKLELNSGIVYEVEALGNGSTKMFYLKQDGNSNRIKITNSASLNNFVEYGHVVGITLKRATYDGGEFILTDEGATNVWEERKTGGGTFIFTEESYDDWSVYLVRDDGVKIQLGVWGMIINMTLPGQEKEKLYDIIEVFD